MANPRTLEEFRTALAKRDPALARHAERVMRAARSGDLRWNSAEIAIRSEVLWTRPVAAPLPALPTDRAGAEAALERLREALGVPRLLIAFLRSDVGDAIGQARLADALLRLTNKRYTHAIEEELYVFACKTVNRAASARLGGVADVTPDGFTSGGVTISIKDASGVWPED